MKYEPHTYFLSVFHKRLNNGTIYEELSKLRSYTNFRENLDFIAIK